MSVAVCLLDLDGTLTDPFTGISRCITHALEAMDLPVPDKEALRKWIGPPLRQSFERHIQSCGEGDPDQAVNLYRERFADTGLYENEVYDGVPRLLESLQSQSFRLIVATSKPTVYATRIVNHFGLEPWLEAVHGSELDGRRTDKIDLLAYVLQQQGIRAPDCVMIGDREFDMNAARHHGMGAIGVLWGYGTPLELLEAGAETLVTSPAELLELLIDSI